jgi:putative transcriptional regulator
VGGDASLKGKLLFSTPALFDPNFRRTVILVGEHGDEGAMGVVLNRPSETTVGEALPDLAACAGEDAFVYVGGPVQPDSVLILAEFEGPTAAATLVSGNVGFARADRGIAELAGIVRQARVFAGYSGWGAGQLESELEEESWLVEPATGVDLFPAPDDDLFADVLRRKGGAYRVLATMPEDPRRN